MTRKRILCESDLDAPREEVVAADETTSDGEIAWRGLRTGDFNGAGRPHIRLLKNSKV